MPNPFEPLAPIIDLCLNPATAEVASLGFFRDLIEPISDSFTDCDVYARLFAFTAARCNPAWSENVLFERYRAIRSLRSVDPSVQRVLIPSRVTIGADISVTSVVLDAAKRALPHARILFAGPAKNLALFSADPRIESIPIEYGRRAPLLERLAVHAPLQAAVGDGIVLDPDSRLTQLGILPIVDESRHFLFESRCYQPDSSASLGQLCSEWTKSVLNTSGTPYLALPDVEVEPVDITVNLGVGGNDSKRIDDMFERTLIEYLHSLNRNVLVDQGAGGEETDRVLRATHGLNIETFQGSFADFAQRIRRSRLYIGYDSAGQHAAAALGIPCVTVFAGFPNERFLQRWTPHGTAPVRVIRADQPEVWPRTRAAIKELLATAAPSQSP